MVRFRRSLCGSAEKVAAAQAEALCYTKHDLPSTSSVQEMKRSLNDGAPFYLYGVSPMWGDVNHDILKHILREGGGSTASGKAEISAWVPVKDIEAVGLTITDSSTARISSPWGDLVSGGATSDPSVLSFEAFQVRRIPLRFSGMLSLPGTEHFNRLKKLMIDAPSEFPLLYWGNQTEVEAAGTALLPSAHGVDVIAKSGKHVTLYNAGQTADPDLFTPEKCIAYSPFLLPEMKYNHGALKYYHDILRRGKVNCSDQWFHCDFVRAKGIELNKNARPVGARYNLFDFKDMKDGYKLSKQLWANKELRDDQK